MEKTKNLLINFHKVLDSFGIEDYFLEWKLRLTHMFTNRNPNISISISIMSVQT